MRKFTLYFMVFLCCAKLCFADGAVAVVNDEIISNFDIENRMKMVLITSKIKDDEETHKALYKQVLETLIDEKIKKQVAKESGITISDDEINSAIAKIEKQGRMQEGLFRTFLTMNNISPTTIDEFVSADLLWFKLIGKRFTGEGRVSDAELESEIEKIKNNLGKDRSFVMEIFMAVKDEKDDEKVRERAFKVYRELKDGADFGVIARNFSDSLMAKNDGNLGWINKGTMENVLDKTVFGLSVDEISEPVRGKYGYYIYTVKDKRMAFEGIDEMYSTSRIVYDDTNKDEVLEKIEDMDDKSCESFNEYAYSLKNESGEMVVSKIDDFPDEFKTEISKLKPFEVSKPFEFDGKHNVLIVCKVEKKYPLPDKERIRQSISASRLEQIAERFFRELKHTAVIKIK